jgi:phosphoglycerate dehydrogenase-like enzyme
MNDLVIQTEHLSPDAAAWLAQRCRLVVCGYDQPELTAALPEARGLVVRTYTIVNEKLLEKASNLRVVARAGVGLDNIDIKACRRRGIEVVYTPDANTQAVVEYVMCLLADALRPRVAVTAALNSKEWNYLRQMTVAPRQMNELTLGILGLGRVGKGVAEVAGAVGFRVLYHDLFDLPPDVRHGAQATPLDALFEQSDVLSVHIDGRPENRGFIAGKLIERMKPNVVFINTSRGFVVDNLSLAAFLKEHPSALAMLDVHEPEPFDAAYPLLGLANARLYPHLASRTDAAMNNMSWVVRDVVEVLEGRTPRFPAP